MTEELKPLPCPLCGGEVELVKARIKGEGDWIRHTGRSCGLEFGDLLPETDLVHRWNTRSPAWRDIESAPGDGTPILLLLDKPFDGNDSHVYVPWEKTRVVMGWVSGFLRGGKMLCEICVIRDGAADTEGYSSQFWHETSTATHWMPLPLPPEEGRG